MKIITVQSHQQSKSLPRTGSDRKEDPFAVVTLTLVVTVYYSNAFVKWQSIEGCHCSLSTCNWGGFEATEYLPFICMEEGNQLGDLAISGGHGNAQKEYAMRKRRCPSCRSTYSVKARQENPVIWSSLFYRHGISTPCLTHSIKALMTWLYVPDYFKARFECKNSTYDIDNYVLSILQV